MQWIAKLVAGLIANRRPGEVSAGIAFGLLLALLPPGNLLWPLLFVVTFFLKLNVGAELAALGIFRLLVPVADPAIEAFGFSILTAGPLQPLFTSLYNVPLFPFTRFNNSMVTGGLTLGVLLWLPVFLLARAGVVGFRNRIQPKLAESRMVKAFTRIPVVAKFGKLLRRFNGAYAAFS